MWYLREVFKVRKHIHVSEWIYSNNRTVSWSFLYMEKRMAELITVCVKKVYRPWGGERKTVSNDVHKAVHEASTNCYTHLSHWWADELLHVGTSLSSLCLLWYETRWEKGSLLQSVPGKRRHTVYVKIQFHTSRQNKKKCVGRKKQHVAMQNILCKSRWQTSPFSKVISLTSGTHLSWAQV